MVCSLLRKDNVRMCLHPNWESKDKTNRLKGMHLLFKNTRMGLLQETIGVVFMIPLKPTKNDLEKLFDKARRADPNHGRKRHHAPRRKSYSLGDMTQDINSVIRDVEKA